MCIGISLGADDGIEVDSVWSRVEGGESRTVTIWLIRVCGFDGKEFPVRIVDVA